MARQVTLEKWRSRALNSEADVNHFVKLLNELFDTKKTFKEWDKTRIKLKKFLALFPEKI